MTLLNEMYEQKAIFNEVAAVTFAYCLAAAFLVKNRQSQVLPSHFLQMLSYMDQESVTFTNMETASNTFDLIQLNVKVSEDVRHFMISNLMNRNAPHFCLVRNILKYINTDRVINGIIMQVTNNGVQNKVTIDDDYIGEIGQGTAIMIDNELVNITTSVVPMVNRPQSSVGIGQNDLSRDYGFEAQRQFIRNNFDIDIGSDSSVYYQTCHNNGNPTCDSIEAATRNLYNDVADRINQGFRGAYDTTPVEDYQHRCVNSAMNQCYGVGPECDSHYLMLNSRTFGHDSFRPDHMFEELYDKELEATSSPMGKPCITISDKKTGQPVFKTRFKKESYPKNVTGYRYKMYFEPSKRT